jgi:ATP-dependent Clp protease ATP-binding subunit ClpC
MDPRVKAILSSGLPDRATDRLKRSLECAASAADEMNHPAIDANLLVCGLVRDNTGIAWNVLSHLDFKFDSFLAFISNQNEIETIPFDGVSDNAKSAMNRSVDWMRRFNHSYLSTEHLLLGLIDDEKVAGAIEAFGVQSEDIRHEVHGLLGFLS